jgi:NDP-sugar pyrophosphorylase family protein
MLPIAGRPFIDHKLDEAARLRADRVVLLLAHGAEQIEAHVRTSPRDFDVEVVLDGPTLLGTGGALKRATGSLGQRVWVTYGDTLLDADLTAAEARAADLGCRGAMTVLRNKDQWEPSNTSVEGGRVVAYSKGDPPGTHEYIDYGYLLIPVAALADVLEGAFDLRVVVQRLVADRDLAAFEVQERFHDIGTPEALRETDAWVRAMVEH